MGHRDSVLGFQFLAGIVLATVRIWEGKQQVETYCLTCFHSSWYVSASEIHICNLKDEVHFSQNLSKHPCSIIVISNILIGNGHHFVSAVIGAHRHRGQRNGA